MFMNAVLKIGKFVRRIIIFKGYGVKIKEQKNV